MSEEMIAISGFLDYSTAHLLRSRLEAEGVLVFLEKDRWGVQPLRIRGIQLRLLVPADEVERAVELLQKLEPEWSWGIQEEQPPANVLGKLAALLLLVVLMAVWAYLRASRG